MFAGLEKFLEGKKTYIVALIGAIIAVAQAFGFVVPEWVWPLLTALGLGTLRAGVTAAATSPSVKSVQPPK